jgi:hypothetical protein
MWMHACISAADVRLDHIPHDIGITLGSFSHMRVTQ